MSSTTRRKKKKAKINNILLLILLVASVLTILAFLINMIRVRHVDTGEGETIEETEPPIENEYTNDFYTIGYNATEINKTYFRELDEAVEGKPESEEGSESAAPDYEKIAQAVVKCFVTEYYTWTNKDGNYDIGGMQYIFTDRQSDFENYTRYNFYADMDLYLTQKSRGELIQVKDVKIEEISKTDNFDIGDASYECWKVSASWSYEDGTSMDVSEIQNDAVFYVVNHNGRLEIASIQ